MSGTNVIRRNRCVPVVHDLQCPQRVNANGEMRPLKGRGRKVIARPNGHWPPRHPAATDRHLEGDSANRHFGSGCSQILEREAEGEPQKGMDWTLLRPLVLVAIEVQSTGFPARVETSVS